MLWSLALFAFVFASAQGRAVNISNTWVLPEEGFPVFYRYFRDRISWYEADAVCQFHHANLVTVDTTAQYDAVRAYLKELDISSAVWVGLIRSNPDGDFTWTYDILPTAKLHLEGNDFSVRRDCSFESYNVINFNNVQQKDYRGLGGDGYWSSAPDPRSAPLCAAADPAADYRWEARACGGPTVASFICELPVPQWALGNEGCMVRELPALTVLYLPESAAVQLTADCGLAGVKKVQCTGNLKRENLLRDLSCAEEDEQSSTPNTGATTSISSSMSSSDNPITDQDTINDITTEDNITTEHEDDINQSTTVIPTAAPYNIRPSLSEQAAKQILNNVNRILISKNLDLDDNMQSNDIPKLVGNDNFLSSDLSDKIEEETHKQHKILHDEIARHGNFETIFTQPTDHFVPPLVMAKAKISDDMTVLSLEEKHAQQLAEQHYAKHLHDDNFDSDKRVSASSSTKDESNGEKSADRTLITTTFPTTLSPEIKKDVLKNIVPKKYNDKYYGLKSKSLKLMGIKSMMNEKSAETSSTSFQSHLEELETTSPKYFIEDTYKPENEPTIDLTVVIKEPKINEHQNNSSDTVSDIPNIMIIQNDTSITKPEIKLENPQINNGEVTQEISVKLPTPSINNFTLNHEIIKITILKEENSSDALTVLEVTTKLPGFDESNSKTTITTSVQDFTYETINNTSTQNDTLITTVSSDKNENFTDFTPHSESISTTIKSETIQKKIYDTPTTHTELTPTTIVSSYTTTESNDNMTEITEKHNSNVTELPEILSTETEYSKIYLHEEEESSETNTTDTSETIDDFQSPLLSGANEPVHRPNRSRRPQPANRNNKFNPFRILG